MIDKKQYFVIIDTNVLVSGLISVNAGEEFPHFADLELPLLGQKKY